MFPSPRVRPLSLPTPLETADNGRQLVLMRHGESAANLANRFTGRHESPLTARGEAQADAAGKALAAQGVQFDAAYASPLQRTVTTCTRALEVLGQSALRIRSCPALVERDYGALSGLNKTEAEARWGKEHVDRWRRSFSATPPDGESLRDTVARVVPAYVREILPSVMHGPTLVVAHGNSLRALIMALEGLSPEEVEHLELPTGALRLYSLGADTTAQYCLVLDPPPTVDLSRW